MKIWEISGRLGYYLTLPALFLQLRWTGRTRVFIKCGNEVLVVKGWLSRGDWSFPGGGIKRNEDPLLGAVREVREETSVNLKPEDLTKLFEGSTTNPHRLTYYCIAFGVELDEKPPIKAQAGELIAAEWKTIDELMAMPDSERLFKRAMDAWGKVR